MTLFVHSSLFVWSALLQQLQGGWQTTRQHVVAFCKDLSSTNAWPSVLPWLCRGTYTSPQHSPPELTANTTFWSAMQVSNSYSSPCPFLHSECRPQLATTNILVCVRRALRKSYRWALEVVAQCLAASRIIALGSARSKFVTGIWHSAICTYVTRQRRLCGLSILSGSMADG